MPTVPSSGGCASHTVLVLCTIKRRERPSECHGPARPTVPFGVAGQSAMTMIIWLRTAVVLYMTTV